MGLSRTVSEIKRRFQSKIANFSHPCVFNGVTTPPLSGFSFEFVNTGRPRESRMMRLPGRERSLTISLAIWIQYTNVTDRRTLGDSKDSAICIASRGNKPTVYKHVSRMLGAVESTPGRWWRTPSCANLTASCWLLAGSTASRLSGSHLTPLSQHTFTFVRTADQSQLHH